MNISRDTCYQFSNRVAFAWKLASLGIPTVLVYLGFTGDDGMSEKGLPFKDGAYWRLDDRAAYTFVIEQMALLLSLCLVGQFALVCLRFDQHEAHLASGEGR